MKHNPNKQRHRGGRPQGKRNGFGGYNTTNRNFDSSGPDIKVRGNAYQIYEKYQQLARDANSAGDRVAAENFLQHAEHYYRILNHDGQWALRQQQMQQQQQQQPQQMQQQGQGGMQQHSPQQHQHQGQPHHGGHSPQLNQSVGTMQPTQAQSHGHAHDSTQDDYQEPDLNNP